MPPGTDRPGVPDRDAYLAGWSGLHGGYDPRAALLPRLWTGLTYRCAVPLVRMRVGPSWVTAAGVVVAGAALAPAAAHGRWPLLAAALVVLSGLLDGLDGAVAVLSDRVTPWGFVLDSVADRVSDGLLLVALWTAGAPAGWCVGAGCAVALLEYGRARAGNAGFGEIGVVTVGERPTRVIVTAAALVTAGTFPGGRAWSAGAGAVALLVTAAVGCLQYAVVARRALRR